MDNTEPEEAPAVWRRRRQPNRGTRPRSEAPDGQGLILYDVDCGFCRWSVAKVVAWDRRARLRVAPIEGPEGEQTLVDLDRSTRLASWHLMTSDGRLHSGGAAFAPLLRLLPGGRLVAALAAAWPAGAEHAYRIVSNRRTLLAPLVPAAAKRRADERIERRQRSPLRGRGARPTTCARTPA
ncbi:MAG: DUF393 domain-containing protein [Thermoleophilaceae bacterium]|nr:DUF393 domain-containing protein [Thermoleophilaceae bacterium]